MSADRSGVLAANARLVGLLPIGFVAWAMSTYDHPANLLWLCNVANLLLAIGLLIGHLRICWLAVMWLIVGAPLWVVDVFVKHQFFPHSVATHLIALLIGLWAIRGRAARRGTWLLATAFGLSVQAICRFWTPAELNINVAHATYKGFSGWFDHYLVYWTLSTLAIAGVLFAIERVLTRFIAAQVAIR